MSANRRAVRQQYARSKFNRVSSQLKSVNRVTAKRGGTKI